MKRYLALSCAGLFVMLAGCLHTTETSRGTPVPKYQVKCGGDCLELRQRAPGDQHALLAKVEDLLKEQRHASIRALVERHPETVIDILRQRDRKQTPTESELTAARAIDALLQHPNGAGWQDRLRGSGQELDRAEDTLQRALDLARHQQWARVAELQKHHASIVPYSYHAVRIGSLVAEAQRNLGHANAAAQTWQQTAVLAARLSPRLQAPDLWEQLAGQRPVSAAWPPEVAAALVARLPARLHALPKHPSFAAEALVWFTIGSARLTRAEATEALTAFKRADSHGAFAEWDDFLTLHQAKALLAMEQTPAATSLLTGLVGRPGGSPWRSSALALLGSGKLQEGHTVQALAFLREAVEAAHADDIWRADAEANLGLVYLMTGEDAKGLQSLHSAQDRFVAGRDAHGAVQCLENEASYQQHLGRADALRQVRLRIQECESSAAK